MIVDWLMNLFGGGLMAALNAVPLLNLDGLLGALGAFGDLVSGIGSLSMWVDWLFIGVCATTAFGLWIALAALRLIFKIYGLVPVIGGHW